MDFPRNADDADIFLGSVQGLISDMAAAQHEAAKVASTVFLLQDRASVTVNAKGVVTQISIDEDVMSTVPGHRLAAELTSAIQRAAEKSAAATQAMWQPVIDRQKNLPRASDILDGLTDTSKLFGTPVEPPLTPPGSQLHDEATYVELEESVYVADDEPSYESVEKAAAEADDAVRYESVEVAEVRRASFTERAW